MALRDDYQAFLRARLASRSDDLRAALAPLLADPPPVACEVEIVLFPDDGVTYEPPIALHAFGPDGAQIDGGAGVVRSNDLLRSMPPLVSDDELDRFYIWEDERGERAIAPEQPIDGVDQLELKAWVRDVWRGLDLRGYASATMLTVHDDSDDDERLFGV